MKATLVLATLFGVVAVQGAERLVLPSCVRQFAELGEARQDAAASGKGITFLLMEPGST